MPDPLITALSDAARHLEAVVRSPGALHSDRAAANVALRAATARLSAVLAVARQAATAARADRVSPSDLLLVVTALADALAAADREADIVDDVADDPLDLLNRLNDLRAQYTMFDAIPVSKIDALLAATDRHPRR